MIIQFIIMIIVLEIVDAVLFYILPKKRLKSAYENAVNMIIFSLIVVLFINIFTSGSISIFSLDDLIKTNDMQTYEFNDYIKIYKELIFNALE